MKKRTWIYIQSPQAYGYSCELCHGSNITWSEFEHKIWCHDCEKDIDGEGGVFDGPIPLGLSRLMGMNFDRIELKTGQRLYMTMRGSKFIYCHKKPSEKYDAQYIKGLE